MSLYKDDETMNAEARKAQMFYIRGGLKELDGDLLGAVNDYRLATQWGSLSEYEEALAFAEDLLDFEDYE